VVGIKQVKQIPLLQLFFTSEKSEPIALPITGANGNLINVTFGWIRNNDGIVRLTTGIPTKK
jgi:hypothetical protein